LRYGSKFPPTVKLRYFWGWGDRIMNSFAGNGSMVF
jgi:hypothetical protein